MEPTAEQKAATEAAAKVKADAATAVAQQEGLDKAGIAIKAGEAPKTVEESVFHTMYYKNLAEGLGGKLKATTDESIQRKEKIRAAEKEAEGKEAARLLEEGKFKELVQTLQPKAEKADKLEDALKGYFEVESANLTEEQRSLIPVGPVDVQLSWLQNAKAKGLFGTPKTPPPIIEQKKKGEENNPDFLTWAPTDTRLLSLAPADYARWKTHNGRDGKSNSPTPAGWGGTV